jgi:glutaminyl-tRNA synthetase
VSKTHAFEVEIREYDRLFFEPSPASAKTNEELISMLNKDSMRVLKGYAEPFLKTAITGNKYQFQRKGYFVTDEESTANKLIFNKTVGLRDNWAKKQKN